MADREVRYCTTEDGVRIAYCVEGEGPPLIAVPYLFESFALEYLSPEIESFMRQLGEERALIRFDIRGTGLSAREAADLSYDALARDHEAVANALGLARFSVWAPVSGGPIGIAFAARHAERVSRLILYGTYMGLPELWTKQIAESFAEMSRVNWDVAARAVVELGDREEFPDSGIRYAELLKRSVSGETFAQAVVQAYASAEPLLSSLTMPTLVLHRIEAGGIPFEHGQKLAAKIPGARLVPLQGRAATPFVGDTQAVLDAVNRFLDEDLETRRLETRSALVATSAGGAIRTVLFTDLVGHTEMMSRLGDDAGRDVLREHERITREVLKANGGTEVKTMGDGFMASFGSVTKAVECAVALQRAMESWNADVGAQHAAPLHVRVGLNAGEPIEEDGDLFGATVILASRIAAKAEGGEILVADTVRGLCSGKGFLFADRGEFVAKGIEEPVRVYEVSWRE